MKFLRNLFHLPTPVELGRADHNALPLRSFLTPSQVDAYTWEDWKTEVEAKYPIKYFFAETFRFYYARQWRRIVGIFYWIQCHVQPKHMWHKLDLRGVDAVEPYTHGYLDPCDVIWLACWKSLVRHVEAQGGPADPDEIWSEDQRTTEEYLERKRVFKEVWYLYTWFTRERKLEHQADAKLMDAIDPKCDAETWRRASDTWYEHTTALETKEDEMLARLIAIRRYLWS